MKRKILIVSTLALAMAAMTSVLVAIFAARVIEERSVEAVANAMTMEGHEWVSISADGLQVFLDGTAPDEAASFQAVSRAGTVVDADRVINRVEVAQAETIEPPRFSVDMLRNGDGIQLIGLVPAATGTTSVTAAIGGISDGVEVTDMIETADFPTPVTWTAALDYGLRALTELPRSKVTVYEDLVEVQAVSESAAQRADFIARLERGQPRGVEVVLDISAPRPVITPFTLRFIRDDGGARFVTCAADTEEARAQIIAAAEGAGAEGILTCQIGLGVPSPQWADAASLGIAAVAQLGAGTISMIDADITLTGVQGADPTLFDRVVGELDAALPDVFSLQAILPEPAAEEDSGPVQFTAELSGEGTVSLRGRVPEGPIGTSVEAFAIAVYGQANADMATRRVPDLPEGWAIRVMTGLQALSLLHEGTLTVDPEQLVLRGVTGGSGIADEIGRYLTEELGPGAEFTVQVAYDEALDPVASLPSPEECVAQIQAIQDEEGKIVFDPGSVTINDAAGEVLDRIAEILPNCTHVRMEISGHTDSQGREEMNLGLSQSRADAVLNGLLARDVLVSNLTAQGYGESQPIADNDTEDGRERNRRIEFRLLSTAVSGEAADADPEAATEAEAGAEGASDETERTPPSADIRPVQRPDSVVEAAAAAAEEQEEQEE
jgi:OOP family OmpA-OmpF porin